MQAIALRVVFGIGVIGAAVGAPALSAWLSAHTPAPRPAANAPAQAAAQPQPATAPAGAGALAPVPAQGGAAEAIAAVAGPHTSVAMRASAYAPLPTTTAPPAPTFDEPLPRRADAAALRQALDAYRRGDVAAGDAAAGQALDDLGRTALEWAALRLQPRTVGHRRFIAFLDANKDWPSEGFLQSRLEDALYNERPSPALVRARFAGHEPTTAAGRMALARAHLAASDPKAASEQILKTWREDDFGTWAESAIRKEFGAMLSVEDYRRRSALMFYKGQHAASLRLATFVGRDYEALAAARAAVAQEAPAERLMAAVPAALREDPTFAFAQVQVLRRAGKLTEAADVLSRLRANVDLVDPGAWWDERKMLARRLLDAGDAARAYTVAAQHAAASSEDRIDAEFHAGWIALRFMGDAEKAMSHFAHGHAAARTPVSLARTLYWQGRAAEALARTGPATEFYKRAAEHSGAYYGQLARARLGLESQPIRRARAAAQGDARVEPVRAVELFEAIGERELSFRLSSDLARTLDSEAQVAALGRLLAQARDARAAMIVGKLAGQRGLGVDDVAFPLFGIPDFERLPRSADTSVVYAIARQESAFNPEAVSVAGAKGLMQMLPSTARVTAKRAGVPFQEDRLLADPAFNAKLGAAHLGELLQSYGDSLILTFAAYNAGGPRVRQWIQAYGDPRSPGVDPIDWVERIPFTETRNYVQRVAENLTMYRVRLGAPDAPALAARDLRAREARLAQR